MESLLAMPWASSFIRQLGAGHGRTVQPISLQGREQAGWTVLCEADIGLNLGFAGMPKGHPIESWSHI